MTTSTSSRSTTTTGWHQPSLKIGAALLGLLLTMVLVNLNIKKYEAHLATGEPVLLELAPVDPRGFMQGDYMALSFGIETDICEALGKQNHELYLDNTEGKVIVRKDAHNVGHFARLTSLNDSAPLANNELAIHYRLRSGQIKFATNAFFFQEGHAEAYEAAEYGLFKVNKDGEPLLTNMVDEKFAVIEPKE